MVLQNVHIIDSKIASFLQHVCVMHATAFAISHELLSKQINAQITENKTLTNFVPSHVIFIRKKWLNLVWNLNLFLHDIASL